MNNDFYQRIQPFFLAGLIIVLAVVTIFIFSYLVMAALLVGAVLYAVSALQRFFFSSSNTPTPQDHQPQTYENGEF